MSDFIVFTRCDGYRFAIPYGDVFSVGDCGDGHCVIQRSSKGSDIVKGSLEEVLAMLKKPQQSNTYDHNKTAIENAHPQPVATGLCEAVGRLVEFYNKYPRACYDGESDLLDAMRLALTAERKRAVLVKEAFQEYRANHFRNCICRACEKYRALDAFDKGAENG